MDTQDREALQEITKELHEIRSELADLKRVLSSGAASTAPSAPSEPPLEAGEEDREAPAGGFFDEEDEDETIALTGDELDNILNTAEFTEEAGQAAEFEDESELYLGSEEAAPTEQAPAPAEEAEEMEPPVEEITLEEIDGEEPETEEPEAQAPEAQEPSPEMPAATVSEAPTEEEPPVEFGDETQVDELAQLDIESELADVDELKDEDEEEEDLGEIDFDEIELGEEEEEEPTAEEAPEAEEAPTDQAPEPVTEEDLLEEETEEAGDVPPSPEEFAAHFDQMEKEEAVTDEEVDEEPRPTSPESSLSELPDNLKAEIRSVLTYMDQLLEALPEEKIQEFAESEHFEVYRRLFEELGIDT